MFRNPRAFVLANWLMHWVIFLQLAVASGKLLKYPENSFNLRNIILIIHHGIYIDAFNEYSMKMNSRNLLFNEQRNWTGNPWRNSPNQRCFLRFQFSWIFIKVKFVEVGKMRVVRGKFHQVNILPKKLIDECNKNTD